MKIMQSRNKREGWYAASGYNSCSMWDFGKRVGRHWRCTRTKHREFSTRHYAPWE